jgi:hypothetical protein
MGESVGEGTYGTVYPYLKNGRDKCVKVLHRANCDSMFHQMHYGSYIQDLAALEDNRDVVQQHLVLPEQLLSLKDGRRGILMTLHRWDLYTQVQCYGEVVGQELRKLHDGLCAGVGWLNDHGIYFCDISPGNTLYGHDGRWRITDPDLWRCCELDLPAYCQSLRPPELLLDYGGLDMGKCDAWAVGMTLDYANRGHLAYRGDTGEAVVREMVRLHPCAQVPRYIMSRLPDARRGKRTRSRDWAVYADLLELHPQRRRALGSGKATLRPAPPWRRMTGTAINKELRHGYAVALLALTKDHDVEPIVLIAALSLVDVWLAKRPQHTELMPCLLLASLYLAHVHTQRFQEKLYGAAVDQVCDRYPGLTKELVQQRAEEVAGLSMWQPPLGRHVWTPQTWPDVYDMIYRPREAYAKYE